MGRRPKATSLVTSVSSSCPAVAAAPGSSTCYWVVRKHAITHISCLFHALRQLNHPFSHIVPNNTKQRSKHPLENSLNCFCWQGLLAHYPRDLAHSSDMLVIPHMPGLCKWDIFTEENKQLPMTSDSVLSTKWQRWSIERKGPFFFVFGRFII